MKPVGLGNVMTSDQICPKNLRMLVLRDPRMDTKEICGPNKVNEEKFISFKILICVHMRGKKNDRHAMFNSQHNCGDLYDLLWSMRIFVVKINWMIK